MNIAFQHAEAARLALADLPDSDYKRALLWVRTSSSPATNKVHAAARQGRQRIREFLILD